MPAQIYMVLSNLSHLQFLMNSVFNQTVSSRGKKKANDNSLLSLIRYQHLNSLLQTTFQPDSIKHSLRQELLVSKRQCRQEVSSLFGEIGNFVTIWRIIVAYLLPRKVHLVYEVPFYTLGSVDKKISICLQENPHQ